LTRVASVHLASSSGDVNPLLSLYGSNLDDTQETQTSISGLPRVLSKEYEASVAEPDEG